MSYFNVEKIQFEGRESTNPFAFKFYNPEEVVMGKKMKDHLKFSVAYWHTFDAMGSDPFGGPSMERAWDVENANDPVAKAKERVKVAFEFMEKLGLEYFAFHDADISPRMATLEETNKVLDEIVDLIESEMKRTGIKLLWATTNAFSDKKFVHGASTSCNADVFAYAAAQVKKAMDIAKRLGAEGYTFWGGREGYETLLNTDMKLELDNLARLLHMAVAYAKEIGFTGQFYIEPKPKEPMKHQYDVDTATVIGFLKTYGLENYFKVNIETNHATLAMHTMQHELRIAVDNDMLGSVDANQGDPMLGWDTDQFPTNIYETTMTMYEIIRGGGFKTGGLNFDSKVRRASFQDDDLFLAHIAGMDAYAFGLKVAARLHEDKVLENFVEDRYASYKSGIGAKIVAGEVGFKELEQYVLDKKFIDENKSGRQEYLEAVINQYILNTK